MTPDELTTETIQYILDNLDFGRLNKWETDFIASITEWVDKGRELSERQKEILGKIWDKQP